MGGGARFKQHYKHMIYFIGMVQDLAWLSHCLVKTLYSIFLTASMALPFISLS